MTIETEHGEDGRSRAEGMDIPGAMPYGQTGEESIKHVRVWAEDLIDLAVVADRRNEPTIWHEKFKREVPL